MVKNVVKTQGKAKLPQVNFRSTVKIETVSTVGINKSRSRLVKLK